MKTKISRRDALKALGLSTAAMTLPGCGSPFKLGAEQLEQNYLNFFVEKNSPVNRLLGAQSPIAFSGDNPEKNHNLLWSTAQTIKSAELPQKTEKTKLVVIGGGMSGLISTYLLRNFQPILLESAERFGGNSKGESWSGKDYSIGAAYFMEQEEGTQINNLFKEVGAFQIIREKVVDDPVVLNQKIFQQFWSGETDPQKKSQFLKLSKYFKDVLNGTNNKTYPEIPCETKKERAHIKSLDKISFYDHIQKILGEKPHPHIETALEHYCWSTFASTTREINAAVGLNCYAAEFGKVYVASGGNAAIAELFMKKTLATVPASLLRCGSTVLEVDVREKKVFVTYQDPQKQIRIIEADAAIMACPKFVVKHILKDMEPLRRKSIEKLRYRSYLVANLILQGEVPTEFYDLYLLDNGQIHQQKLQNHFKSYGITDIVLATYAKAQKDQTILTLYRGLPFDGARAQILGASYEQLKSDFTAQIDKEILPLLGFKQEQKIDLRLTRWGHPMPVPQLNFLSDGTVDQIRKPFKDRVFFVEQDNWLLPAIETCATEALYWAPQVEKVLKSI